MTSSLGLHSFRFSLIQRVFICIGNTGLHWEKREKQKNLAFSCNELEQLKICRWKDFNVWMHVRRPGCGGEICPLISRYALCVPIPLQGELTSQLQISSASALYSEAAVKTPFPWAYPLSELQAFGFPFSAVKWNRVDFSLLVHAVLLWTERS